MRINLGDDEQPEIGLIALIDCIFFLLMFFMVATSFKQQQEIEKQQELPVVLPTASASLLPSSVKSNDALAIGVDKNGKFYIDGAEIGTQALHDRLAREASANPQRQVRIDGDRATPYQHIVHVLDLCQLAGLTTIAMHTRK